MYVHKQFIRQVNVTVTCRLTRHHGTMGESERPLGKPKALELLLPYEHDEYSWEVFDEKIKNTQLPRDHHPNECHPEITLPSIVLTGFVIRRCCDCVVSPTMKGKHFASPRACFSRAHTRACTRVFLVPRYPRVYTEYLTKHTLSKTRRQHKPLARSCFGKNLGKNITIQTQPTPRVHSIHQQVLFSTPASSLHIPTL